MLKSQEKYGLFGYDPETAKEETEKENRRKKTKVQEKLMWICTVSFLVLGLCVFFLEAWIHVLDQPVLELNEDTVVLEKGQSFEPMHYVREQSISKGTLILPKDIDTDETGTKAAVYKLQYGDREIMRTLLLKVEEKDTSE